MDCSPRFRGGQPQGEFGFIRSGESLSAVPGSEVLAAFNFTPGFKLVEVGLFFELFAEITITDPNNPEAGLIVCSASLSLSNRVMDVSTDPPFTMAMPPPICG